MGPQGPPPPQITIIGGGMITHDQILPSLYQAQRMNGVGQIDVCAQHGRTVKSLAESEGLKKSFPRQSFRSYPDPSAGNLDEPQPELYRQVISKMAPRNIVCVAVPDMLHYDVIMTALKHNQHVLCVKPLTLQAAQSVEIEREAAGRGLFVGIEYHKRFDDRSLLARKRYREGYFGEFKLGTACLLEKWYYRNSNFQNWCTTENSDAFTYIGCHYVDLVHFITGLMPVSVSVYGVRDRYPNGNEGFLWTDARILWNNGACLNVQNAIGFPDEAPGTNTQGLSMYCSDGSKGAWLEHSDQYRGLRYCYTRRPDGPGSTVFAEPSTDYFQLLDFGEGLGVPAGYGFRSIHALLVSCMRVEMTNPGMRSAALRDLDAKEIVATPANSRYNELVIEAGRLSILNGGREAVIDYGPPPSVRLREY